MILATVLVWNRLWLSIVVIVVVDKVSGEKNYQSDRWNELYQVVAIT